MQNATVNGLCTNVYITGPCTSCVHRLLVTSFSKENEPETFLPLMYLSMPQSWWMHFLKSDFPLCFTCYKDMYPEKPWENLSAAWSLIHLSDLSVKSSLPILQPADWFQCVSPQPSGQCWKWQRPQEPCQSDRGSQTSSPSQPQTISRAVKWFLTQITQLKTLIT